MTNKQDQMEDSISEIICEMAQRPQGTTLKEVIAVLRSSYPNIEFRADHKNDSVAWRDKKPATNAQIIPFKKRD